MTAPGEAPAWAPGAGALADASGTPYAGLVTRTVAFVVDAVLINLAVWVVGAVVALALTIIPVSDQLPAIAAAVGGVLAVAWAVGYFAFFWSTTGQTPGDHLLELRVVDATTLLPPRPARATLRALIFALSALILFLGCLLVLVDARRRALHDVIAGTLVIYSPSEPRPRPR